MTALLGEIIQILVSGITQLASGIGSGLMELIGAIFVTGTGTTESPYTLTVFGGLIIVFAGIALAIGLSRFVMNWVTGFGS